MIPRLYIDAVLREGQSVPLDQAQLHYLHHVLRRKDGSEVVVFNGRDGEFYSHFSSTGKKSGVLVVKECKRSQGEESDLWLCFAPLQRSALEMVIEKGTEMGVSRFLPTLTQYSGPHRIRTERLVQISKEAAEQTERLTLPSFSSPKRLSERLAEWPSNRQLLCCAEWGASLPLADALATMKSGAFAIMTGPEGGYSETELDLIGEFPFVTKVSLGPRILRAETAAIASLAIFQALLGDGRLPSPRPMRETE